MKTKLFIFSLCLSALFISCSDDAKTGKTNSDPDSYLPLTLNNLWSYKEPGMTLTEKNNIIITGTSDYKGNTYYELSSLDYVTRYIRKDGNGNIIELNDTTENIIVPAVIQLDSTWFNTDSTLYNKVTFTNKTINAYTNLLVIETYDVATDIWHSKSYYKKGLGIIYRYDRENGVEITLDSYELK